MRIALEVDVSDELREQSGPMIERILGARLVLAAGAAMVELLAAPSVEWDVTPDLIAMSHGLTYRAVVSAPIAAPIITIAEAEAFVEPEA